MAIFGKYSQHNALRVFVKPLTAAAAGSRRHANALYGVNAAAERTPGAVNVPQRSAILPTQPKSLWKSWGGWEKLGRLLFVILFEPPHKTISMPHPPTAHGQCRQPYHRCDQCLRVSLVSPSIPQVRASLVYVRRGVVWFVQPCVSVIRLQQQIHSKYHFP